MERRDFVKSLGVGALGAVVSSKIALAGEHKGGGKIEQRPRSSALKKVMEATQDCIAAGDICIAHCNAALAAGHTDMAECQSAVMNMVAVCQAMSKASSLNSADEKNLKALAKTCAEFCRSCEKACEKHAGHHSECKKCMESCQACAKACETYSA